MDEDQQIRALLEEALNAGRTPEEVCVGRPDLLEEVRARWIRIRQLNEELERTFPTHRPAEPDPSSPKGQTPEIPGYLVKDLLGSGGMGVVYRARDLKLDRDVAVKLLQEKYASDSRVAGRFSDEARITAQLQHPGIPPVHDVGALPDGRPFLAMKLIDGSTLDRLLAARRSPADERGRFVTTFEQICQAVGYAHAHNVIHRDLKPSNVMVGAFGEVQLMDWGLAKVLIGRPCAPLDPQATRSADASTAFRLTRTSHQESLPGDLFGTPAFMSPEQAVGAVDRIDTRSDVYCLGGILCAILTGKPPHIAQTSEAARQLAAQGRLDDARARLDGCGAEPELVALCLRCLAPVPDNRPRDAAEVAAAVAALRAAADERAQRAELDRVRVVEQARRRRALLAAGAALVGVLLAGLGASLWQMWRASQALAGEQQARQDEIKARQQAFDALRSMTTDVVERKFAQGAVLTEDDRAFLRSVIAQFDAFAAIKGDDAESQAVRAEGRLRVGTMRYRLGDLNEAQQDYDSAVSVYRRLMAEFPARPEFRQDLANCCNNRGHLLLAIGLREEAERDYDEAIRVFRQLVAEFPSRVEFKQQLAGSENNRGIMRASMGRLPEAKEDYDEALGIRAQLVAEYPERSEFREDLATSHNNRGVLQRGAGRLEEAEKDYGEALRIRAQLVTEFPDRPELRQQLATSHNNRGVLLREAGRLNDAKEDCDQALAIYLGLAADFPSRPEFRQQLATSHTNRGNLLYTMGLLDAAEADCTQALTLRRRLAADFPDQPDMQNQLATACSNSAAIFRRQGRWDAARQLLLEGRPHHLAALQANPNHPGYRQNYRNHLTLLTLVHAALLAPEDAVATAETCRDLGWDPSANAYDAACALSQCASIVAEHEQLNATQREAAATFYADAAMTLLHDAASKGFAAVAQIKQNAGLDPLRQRDDFRALVAELERKEQ